MPVKAYQLICVLNYALCDILGWLPSSSWFHRATHMSSLFEEDSMYFCFVCFFVFLHSCSQYDTILSLRTMYFHMETGARFFGCEIIKDLKFIVVQFNSKSNAFRSK